MAAWGLAMAGFGIDYSYGQGLTTAQMHRGGVTFVCRYLAYLPNGKCINKAEFDNLVKAGIKVVLVWEQDGRDCMGGRARGVAHAQEAAKQAHALTGSNEAVIYFAPCDFDAAPGMQPLINGYLDGAASVIGHGRTGMYGGFWPLSRALDGRHAAYGWQTYAWSGTNLDRRASLYQYHNGVRFGPAEVDYDKSFHDDFGQWPRPHAAPAPAHAPAAPAKPPAFYEHTANGTDTWAEIASGRNMQPGSFAAEQWELGQDTANKLFGSFVPPAGAKYRTKHP